MAVEQWLGRECDFCGDAGLMMVAVLGSMMVVVGLMMMVVGILTDGWYALCMRVGKQQKMNAMFYSCLLDG